MAIEKFGYENLSGSLLREALFSIKDYDTGLIPSITITEEEPFVTKYLRINRIRDGRFWAYSDWIEQAYPVKP